MNEPNADSFEVNNLAARLGSTKLLPPEVAALARLRSEADDVEAEGESTADASLLPFLRWPGGKRWFVADHHRLIPKTFNRYIEPFLGSGSVYFHLAPESAIIGDVNADVIRAFQGIETHPAKVQLLLEEHHTSHDKEYYAAIRQMDPRGLAEQAARIIYLNRTCFNGIYRLNRAGRFNVPMGERTQVVFPTDNFVKASALLSKAEILASDFEPVIDMAKKGDLVFADPPYTVRHNTNGFVRYNETLFSWADQVRLAGALNRARRRGVQILSTNAAHDSVRELYNQAGFTLRTISRFSPIAARADSRKQFEELVITA